MRWGIRQLETKKQNNHHRWSSTRGKTRPRSWGSLTGTSKSNALRLKHAPRCPNQCHLDQPAKMNKKHPHWIFYYDLLLLSRAVCFSSNILRSRHGTKTLSKWKNNFRNPNYVVEICHSLSTKASWPLPVLLRCLRRSERACAWIHANH